MKRVADRTLEIQAEIREDQAVRIANAVARSLGG